jgi:hypothetical protein
MIRTAKQLVMDQGIMSSPNPKPGKTLNEVTVEVTSFYNSDEVSRVMTGKKDYISIKVSGFKIHEQKKQPQQKEVLALISARKGIFLETAKSRVSGRTARATMVETYQEMEMSRRFETDRQ